MTGKLPEHIVTRVADAVAALGSAQAVADQYDVPEEAVRRVMDGKGLRSANYQRFMAAFSPVTATANPYWDGVRYASEAMAETVARLLREARQGNEAAALEARALAAIPPAGTAVPADLKTQPPRRRRGTG